MVLRCLVGICWWLSEWAMGKAGALSQWVALTAVTALLYVAGRGLLARNEGVFQLSGGMLWNIGLYTGVPVASARGREPRQRAG